MNRLGILSSSKGSVPHSKAYRITPIDQTSTSAPAYRLPLMTCVRKCTMVSLDERVFHVLSVKRIMKRKEEEKKEIEVISEKGKAREDS